MVTGPPTSTGPGEPTATDSDGRVYEWLGLIGRGGFGEVWRARMISVKGVQRIVAVKMLPEGHAANSPSVERLRKEAEMLAKLDHPVVVVPYDLAEFGTRVALVTEFIEGADLASCIDPSDAGRLPVSTQLEVVEQVASALEAVWTARNVVHRDVKPQNIRIGKHGNVKLLDFGLASSDGLDGTVHTVDRAAGTIRYLAPEGFIPQRPMTPAADVYSLGCVLYEGITGAPFVGTRPLPKGFGVSVQPDDWTAYVDAQMVDVRDPGLRALLDRMLAYSPEQRPTASEVRERCGQLTALDPARVTLSKWCRERTWSDSGAEINKGGNSPRIRPQVTGGRTKPLHLDGERLAALEPTLAEQAHVATCVSCRGTRRLFLDELRIGPYKVLGKIGQGGMASVFAAEHADTGERRALKVLRLVGLENRTRRESELQVRVESRHVLPLLEVHEYGPAPVLVLPLVEGPTLAGLLKDHQPPAEVAAAWFAAIVDGVAALHRLGLVHRDLKPGNVLLDPSSGTVVPKIADFGLAKWLLDENPPEFTKTGMLLGTWVYMAPEQRLSAKDAERSADVWSLGMVALELFTGTTDQSLVDSLPAPWPDILRRMLEQVPLDRPADATEVAAMLPATQPVDDQWVAWCRALAPQIQREGVPPPQFNPDSEVDLPPEPEPEPGPVRWAWLALIATALVATLAIAGGTLAGVFDRDAAVVHRTAPVTSIIAVWKPPAGDPVARPRRIETSIRSVSPPPAPPPPLVDVWIRTIPWGHVTVAGQTHRTDHWIPMPVGSNVLTLSSHDGKYRTEQTIDITPTGSKWFCWSFAEERACTSP